LTGVTYPLVLQSTLSGKATFDGVKYLDPSLVRLTVLLNKHPWACMYSQCSCGNTNFTFTQCSYYYYCSL